MDQTEMKIASCFYNCIWSIPKFSEYNSQIQSQKNVLIHCNENVEWSLFLDPNTSEEKISIYLTIVTKIKININCKISLQDNNGKCIKSLQFFYNYLKSSAYGHPGFIERKKILPLNSDTLIVKCWINVNPISNSGHIEHNCNDQHRNMFDNFNELLISGDFSDVLLQTCDGIEFPAHKFILGSSSPVFKAMFVHNMKEKQDNKVIIEDVDSNILKALLEFIYSYKFDGKLTNLDQLFILSDRYQINNLKKMCEMELCQQLTVENATDYLILGHNYHASQLKKQTLDFIHQNLNIILEKKLLKNLEVMQPDLLTVIIEHLKENTDKKNLI